MNKWTGTGRLTKETELTYSQSGIAYLRNSIAVNRRREEVDFFEIKAFGKTAEAISQYLKKGSKLVIEGHLRQEEYENKEGKKVSNVVIIIDSWEFAESKKESGEAKPDNDFLNVADGLEDLPFN